VLTFAIMDATNRQLFFRHIAQTSPNPIGFEIVRAEGIYQYTAEGRQMVDLISGFSVANIGHSHPDVIAAVRVQAEQYMHLIVYGEFIQQPQVRYAKALTDHLPQGLNCVYFTNSGTEATEGAMKLAKRVTKRTQILSCTHSYHGSTQGALSMMGSEYWRNAYRPLLPGIQQYAYGSWEMVAAINHRTAAVFVEPVQAESGVTTPPDGWLQALREACNKHCALLIFDEIQAGFGRTGKLWAFEHSGVVPDVLLLGKALGGGMPLGAFIAHESLMRTFTNNPVLGHISTFAGHPVSCAAGLAAFEVLLNSDVINTLTVKETMLRQFFATHFPELQLQTAGLWGSVAFDSFDTNLKKVHACWDAGLITDWFLHAAHRLRIAPPLTITTAQWKQVLEQLGAALKAK